MEGVGSARGIRLGAEFEVYQDQDSLLLGIVVASELEPFSTTLYAKEPGFTLKGDGVARQTSAGTRNMYYESILQTRPQSSCQANRKD